MKSFGQQIIDFLFSLDSPSLLPDKVGVMNPYKNEAVQKVCKKFFLKYYNDHYPRTFIIGINPGRYGAGITGIPFTDPIRLEKECDIENPFNKKQELSSVYIYDVIRLYGGPAQFYSRFYFTSVSPLGFVSDGKNLNYYDNKALRDSLIQYIVQYIDDQKQFGAYKSAAICLGEGKNYQFLLQLNKEYKFFDTILPLPHPRFIMQYRFRKREEYIKKYLTTLMAVPEL